MAVVLAVLGAILVALGISMWSIPAGVVAAGIQAIAAAYVVAYLNAKARTGK